MPMTNEIAEIENTTLNMLAQTNAFFGGMVARRNEMLEAQSKRITELTQRVETLANSLNEERVAVANFEKSHVEQNDEIKRLQSERDSLQSTVKELKEALDMALEQE